MLFKTRYSLTASLRQPEDTATWKEFLSTYEAAMLRYCRSRDDAIDDVGYFGRYTGTFGKMTGVRYDKCTRLCGGRRGGPPQWLGIRT
ncbi:MAG: hypothetical protein AAF958_18325 [Planctomycetota bacterium]